MPIVDPNEAKDLDEAIERLIRADSAADREARLRYVFVEKLDFTRAGGVINLRGERCPVEQAVRIAAAEGVHVVWAPQPSARILISDTRAISKALKDLLGDHLLVASNAEGAVWHFVYPAEAAAKPVLRRMVVERGLPRRTVVTQLAKVYHEAQKTDVRHALESAYDVEPVTKDFFTTYRRVFDEVMRRVQGVPNEERRRLFCQTLFNRLMFLYFVQRKGWLKFNGDSNYLPALLRASRAAGNENFFRDRLKTLFFAGLNNPQSVDVSRGASAAIGEVPFLNGGLFEEGEIDRQCAGAEVPDEAFDAILGGLFERFNFTVSENTPYDIEVAVDPEMLGKVFEELVTGRHETGSYYTPRPVVAFMCREALKGYLETKVLGLSAHAIRTFVDEHDVSGLDLTQADAVSDALDEVAVCDPACGSGAYLVGMLHELIELKQALYSERLSRDPTKLYDMKLHIIERSLYGADVDEFAINITMLRLWLSLIIDFEGETPPPLPNLDFKIVCGDSLTAPNPQHAPDLFRHVVHEAAGRLADLKGRYLRESGPDKPRLKTQIEDAERELQEALVGSPAPVGSVDWRVEFAEVFDTNGGFDIVLANPPYVRHEDIGGTKDRLRLLYGDATTGRSDLYTYFYVRGLQILRSAGMHVFVCSNTWLDTEFGVPLLKFLTDNSSIAAVYESQVERQFSTAAINTIISVLRNGVTDHDTRFVSISGPFVQAILEFKENVEDRAFSRQVRQSREVLAEDLRNWAAADASPKWGGRFLRAPKVYPAVFEALSADGKRLRDYVTGERYLNTGGADGFFILTGVSFTPDGLCVFRNSSKEGAEYGCPVFNVEKEFVKPAIKATDLPGLVFEQPDCWVLCIPDEVDIRSLRVSEYLRWGEAAGFSDRSVPRTQTPWWRPPLQARHGALILWGRSHGAGHRVFLNPQRFITVRFFRLHPVDDYAEAVWALLNSTVYALLKEVHGRRGLGHGALETGLVDILPLPVPALTDALCQGLNSAMAHIRQRSVGSIEAETSQLDRRVLDEVVLEHVGLPRSILDDVYEATIHLVHQRAARADSISV